MKYLLLLSLRSVKANKWLSFINIAVIALSVAMVVVTSGLISVLTEIELQSFLNELPYGLSDSEIALRKKEHFGLNATHILGGFFNMLILILSSFMIYGTFATGTRKRTKLMATLMTVGATDAQKNFVPIVESLILALVGIPLGITIGFPIVFIVAVRLETILHQCNVTVDNIFVLNTPTLLKLTAISVLTVLLATLISVVKTQKRSIVTLAKTTSDIEITLKKSPLDWIMWRVFGKAGELAAASYVNQKRIYRPLSRAFSIAMALYVGGSVLIPYILQMGTPQPAYTEYIWEIIRTLNTAIMTVPLLAMITAVCMFVSAFQYRKKEFAIYQSIGMDIKMIRKIIALEWVYRGFFLFLKGLIGAYVLNFAMYCFFVMADMANYLINPFMQLLQSLFLIVVLCALMTAIMIYCLHRTKIVETLKNN